MNPQFLPLPKILELHERQILLYGGEPSIRDMNLLESALAMPESGIGDSYFHAFPFEMAAAYLFHIVQNHLFVDGNKRTGAVAAIQKPEIAKFLEEHSVSSEPET